MRIAVLIKQVPDTWGTRELDLATGRLRRAPEDAVIDEIDERALEVALRVKDARRDTEVIAVTMGPASAEAALRKALSMGADRGVHLHDGSLAGADIARTAAVLSEAIRSEGPDLVIAGDRSTDGGGGVVPAMIAELLGHPLLDALDEVAIGDDVSGTRRSERGLAQVRAMYPAVVSVTERAAEPRFPGFKGILAAKRKQVDERPGSGDVPASASTLISVEARPARTAGRIVVDDGGAVAELADFLAAERLI